jgi:hypothetical protein
MSLTNQVSTYKELKILSVYIYMDIFRVSIIISISLIDCKMFYVQNYIQFFYIFKLKIMWYTIWLILKLNNIFKWIYNNLLSSFFFEIVYIFISVSKKN